MRIEEGAAYDEGVGRGVGLPLVNENGGWGCEKAYGVAVRMLKGSNVLQMGLFIFRSGSHDTTTCTPLTCRPGRAAA